MVTDVGRGADDLARRANHLPRSVTCESISSTENIPLRADPKSPVELPPSRPARGALAIVTDVGRDAVDAFSVRRGIGRQGGSTP
jgi:hypothetical protein